MTSNSAGQTRYLDDPAPLSEPEPWLVIGDARFHSRMIIGSTSFARSTDEALQTARVLRDTFGIEIMKLDVRPSDNLPDNGQTGQAAQVLTREGFAVLPFIGLGLLGLAALSGGLLDRKVLHPV